MVAMANSIDKIKKLRGRSWKEIRFRGEQVLNAYADKLGFAGILPSNSQFGDLIDPQILNRQNPTEAELLENFRQTASARFFPSFANKSATTKALRECLGKSGIAEVLRKAEKIVEGKFDLLGFEELDFGKEINWHYEPVSKKNAPIRHWKQYDELDSSLTGDKKIIWELNRHQHFFTLGEAYWVTGDEFYAETFIRHLQTWIEQNPPEMGINWISSLEVSFRAISWLWGLHFFKDSINLTAEAYQEILKYLYVHGRHIEKYLSTYYSPNTHLTGEALGLYYLGTQLPELKISAQWRKMGREILLEELDKQILEDGIYFEQSSWYHRYTTDFYTHFLILKTVNQDQFGAQQQEKLTSKLQLQLDYLMYLTRPDGTTPFLGDDDGGKLYPKGLRSANDFRSALANGTVLFRRSDYKYVADELDVETLWLTGTEGIEEFESLEATLPSETSKGFTLGGQFILRDGWAETDNYMVFDCAPHGALSCGHSHADALSFELAVAGRTLLVDPGTYSYHESAEIRNHFRSTSAHNTLTIDGESSSKPGAKFKWETVAKTQRQKWIGEARFDFIEGSQDGYERLSVPAAHSRSVMFLKNDYWVIRDYVETFGKHDYQLNFQFDTDAAPEIRITGNDVTFLSEKPAQGVGLDIFTFGDKGVWNVDKGLIAPCYGASSPAPHAKFISQGSGAQEFFTFLLPHQAESEMPDVFETEVVGGRAFVISYQGYRDLLIFNDGEGVTIRTDIFDSNFRFAWARFLEGENLPEEMVLIDGTSLVLGGREVINYPKELDFATIRRIGSKVNVRVMDHVFSVSLPQKKSRTYVLKNDLQSPE